MHVAVVNVGRTVEALRSVTIGHGEGKVLAPRYRPERPSKPLTREQPVMELLSLPSK
jgi:hypothetical protein